MKLHSISLCLITSFVATNLYADNPITINNNYSSGQASQNNAPSSNCNNSSQNTNANAQRPGTYYQSNPNGGNDTIYTTGDKTPYNADINSNCNSAPIIQPFVYGPNAPGPWPGPRENARGGR